MPEYKLLFVFLTMTVFHYTSGQSYDTLFVESSLKNSIQTYNLETTNQSGLFSGTDYAEPRRTNENHPFFLLEEWQEGDVEYRGQVYKSVPFLYDLTTQRLVSELFNGQPFALVTEHVGWFTLGERMFLKIDNVLVNNGLPASGYYEQVYDGKTKVLVFHTKAREERIEQSAIQVYFNVKTRYYIFHDGNFVRITNKAGLLKVLADHRGELRSFINKQKISFTRGALSKALQAVASYYDTLKPEIKP